MSSETYLLRSIRRKLETAPAASSRFWSILALLLPLLVTAYFDRQLKATEHRLSLDAERTKAALTTELEKTKIVAASRVDRGDNFYKARLEVYEVLWADAAKIPSLARQSAVDRAERQSMIQVLDHLADTYHAKALYLSEDARTNIDLLYSDGFRAVGGRSTPDALEQHLRALRTAMQNDLQLREIEKVAMLPQG